MRRSSVCAIIPAAGHGSRLGLEIPKILAEIAPGILVWDILWARISEHVDLIHVVLSPSGWELFARHAGPQISSGRLTLSVQDEPTGMGDAIFGATSAWSEFESTLVIWGDQVNLSERTVATTLGLHHKLGAVPARTMTVPLVPMKEPYVEYIFVGDRLDRIRLAREGDQCRPGGLSDIGIFCLSTTDLAEAWTGYVERPQIGPRTGEVNFLPFLVYLTREKGWAMNVVPVDDEKEACGVNTLDDLAFARAEYLRSQIIAP